MTKPAPELGGQSLELNLKNHTVNYRCSIKNTLIVGFVNEKT